MLTMGILCSREDLAETVEQTVCLLAARAGMDYVVKNIHISDGKTERWEDLTCVILCLEDRIQAFDQAQLLWGSVPSLPVVYVAYSAEDLFASFGLPFFHTARIYHLEQDLEAAFRKLARWRLPAAEKVRFDGSKGILLVRRNEILYLESQHHEIWLHLDCAAASAAVKGSWTVKHRSGEASSRGSGDLEAESGQAAETEVAVVTEPLTQCEEKLRGAGFVRIHRSFLVNMYRIRRLEHDSVVLDNGERLYISRHRYPDVKLKFENYIRHLDFLQ